MRLTHATILSFRLSLHVVTTLKHNKVTESFKSFPENEVFPQLTLWYALLKEQKSHREEFKCVLNLGCPT